MNPKRDDLEAAIDAALASCDGDARAAIAALIIALSFTEAELERAREHVSRGYVRGELDRPMLQ